MEHFQLNLQKLLEQGSALKKFRLRACDETQGRV